MSGKYTRGVARAADIRLASVFGRQLLPLAVVLVALWILRDKIPSLDVAQVWLTLQQFTALQWAAAAIATACSFWAVGRYDQVVHGLMGTSASNRQARISGAAAMAVAQFAGFGVLSSALVRWRLLPDMTLPAALRMSLAVSLSFLAGWAVVTAITVLGTGFGSENMQAIAQAVLAGAGILLAILIWQPEFLPPLPAARAALMILFLALIDTFFAGAALYALLPADIGVTPAVLIPAFLIALGVGLVGGTPGGVGPFEITLLALLPTLPHEPLLATALAFRMVYYVAPALVAFVVLFRGPMANRSPNAVQISPAPGNPFLPPLLERTLWQARRAEVNLLRQGGFATMSSGTRMQALITPVGQSLLMLADPLDTDAPTSDTLRSLRNSAERRQRAALIYKCSARTALAARKMGWSLLPVAHEAWLRPASFSIDGPKRRQLRRQLRKAEKSGVTIKCGLRRLPLEEMAQVSQQWAQNHGGERGFSMGQFDADYINCQRVFLAYQGTQLIAFVTLHEVHHEWTLDLMRHQADAPDGTMHLLICAALQKAAALSLPRLSLAAVPCAKAQELHMLAWLRAHLFKSSSSAGLLRFKSSFAPNWETLYAAAPSKTGLLIGLWAVKRCVNRAGLRR